MSGIEVAGIVLAVIPLLIVALEHYKAGIGTASAFIKWRGQLERLIDQLRLQRTSYFIHTWELLKYSGILPDFVQLVKEEDCTRILEDSSNKVLISGYLGPLYWSYTLLIRGYEDDLKQIVETLHGIRRLSNTAQDDIRSIVEANPAQNGKFAFQERVNFTLEKTKLRALIDDIKERNSNFNILIQGVQHLRKRHDTVTTSQNQHLLEDLTVVRKVVRSLHAALSTGFAPNCHNEHHALFQLSTQLPNQDLLSGPRVAVTSKEAIEFQLYFRHDNEAWQHVVIQHPSHNERLSARVINDMRHDLRAAQQQQQSLITQLDEDRLRLSPKASVARDSLQDKSHVFTLDQVLEIISGSGNQLDLDICTFLAYELASSVLKLCDTPWLSEPWTNKSIAFFGKSAFESEKVAVNRPLYRHVLLRGAASHTTACPRVAVPEFGILLLEIWNQRTLDSWIQEQETRSLGQEIYSESDGCSRSMVLT